MGDISLKSLLRGFGYEVEHVDLGDGIIIRHDTTYRYTRDMPQKVKEVFDHVKHFLTVTNRNYMYMTFFYSRCSVQDGVYEMSAYTPYDEGESYLEVSIYLDTRSDIAYIT